MARMLYPPPGKTTTAAPVLFACGATYSVMVGTVTSPSRMMGRPAIGLSVGLVVSCSGPGGGAGVGFAPGAADVVGVGTPLGQIGICVCPAEGGQPDWAAAKEAIRNAGNKMDAETRMYGKSSPAMLV